jgi:hypothetical protein
MRQRHIFVSMAVCFVLLALAYGLFAQQPAAGQRQGGPGAGASQGQREGRGGAAGGGQRAGGGARGRAPLFFREEWKQTPAGGEHPVNPAEALSNPNLELKLYGPSSKEFLLTGAATDENNPIHLWTGMCTSPCGATLRDKSNFADLTGLARMKWVTKMSGYHQVRPLIKLADGTLLVGDRADGSTVDWLQTEFTFSDMRWRRLDPERAVTTGDWVNAPNLSKVDEIGFVDLLPGSGHGQGGWSDVAAIEVYAKPVKRE